MFGYCLKDLAIYDTPFGVPLPILAPVPVLGVSSSSSFPQGDLLGSALLWQMSEAQNCRCLSQKSRAPETRVPSTVQYPALSTLSAAGLQHAPMWLLGTGLFPGEGRS